MTVRSCTKCGRTYPTVGGNFYVNKTGKSAGRISSWCMQCMQKASADRQAKRRSTPEGLKSNRDHVRNHRLRHDPDKFERTAAAAALVVLIERHSTEYAALVVKARERLRTEIRLQHG